MRNVRQYIIDPEKDRSEWARALVASRIPERYRNATEASIPREDIRAWFKQQTDGIPAWLQAGKGFWLNGPLGSGKSSLAGLLLMDALRRAERCLWVPVRDIPSIRFHESEEAKIIDAEIKRTDLLVLDDLGAEKFKLKSAAGSALEEAVRMVYDRQRALIVTSNLSWRQFQETYGQDAAPLHSVIARIVEPVEVMLCT